MKHRRQAAICDIVAREPVRSQEQLRRRLAARGFRATQATLSRDIKELGLVKRAADGAYQADAAMTARPGPAGAPRQALARTLVECLTGLAVSQQLLVVHTGAGQASLVGLAIDRARLPEVIGTVAGDDTVLVVCRTPRAARTLLQQFERMA